MRPGLIRSRRTWYIVVGVCVAATALLPPLHELSEERLSAHMIQHELLMAVAAPLLVVGRPLALALLTLPRDWRAPVARLARKPSVRRVWSAMSAPFVAWFVHALAIWLWHIPPLFDGAVRDDLVHVTQHASFLGSGMLFWWTIAHPARRANRGLAIVALFTTAIHTAVLGALMTFARQPWYDVYSKTSGVTAALADQQLAGMIMWIPASLVYLIAALLVVRRWLADSELESSRAERGIAFTETVEPPRNDSDPSSRVLLGMTRTL